MPMRLALDLIDMGFVRQGFFDELRLAERIPDRLLGLVDPGLRHVRRHIGRRDTRSQDSNRLNNRQAFTPPNPNELDIATLTVAERA